jgi:hypothetical protein
LTYIELINKVLIRLREDTVDDLSQPYTQLIGEFINESKREVEDSWRWVQLRTTIQVPATAGNSRYTLTGSGDRSKIMYVINDTDDFEMRLANSKWMTLQFTTSTVQQSSPIYYDLNGQTGGDSNVDVFPIPDASYFLNFNMIIPQSELTVISEELTVPDYPVLLGAYAKAIAERGEDSGLSYRDALVNAEKALSDAIAIDAINVPSELIWEQV